MKKLILIRHAKSEWENQTSDFDRPIKESGIKKSLIVAAELKQKLDFNLDKIYCSSAMRTKETAEIFMMQLNPDYIVKFEEDLYTFNLNELTEFIRNIPNKYNNVMIFGHNEGLTDFINHFGNKKIDNLSTSGTVCLEFNSSWNSIEKGTVKWVLLYKDFKDE